MADELPINIDRPKAEKTLRGAFPLHAFKRQSESVAEENITGTVCDINGAGFSFLSEDPYTAGETLSLRIDLPGSNHFFKVKVIRIETSGDLKIITVVFVEMSPEHEQALSAALFSRS